MRILPMVVLQQQSIGAALEKAYRYVVDKEETYTNNAEGSGWDIWCPDNIYLEVALYQTIRVGSYIELPVELKTIKANSQHQKQGRCLFKVGFKRRGNFQQMFTVADLQATQRTRTKALI